jgi:hypothetical protein
MAAQLLIIAAQIAASYIISRATAPDGPRLKDLSATDGNYGIPMPRAYGDKVRAPGIFIAMSDIDEDKHKTGGTLLNTMTFGVAGATGLLEAPSPSYYTYSVPALALMLADRANDDPIEGLDKVWANGKLIWKASTATVDAEAFDGDGRLIWRRYKKNKFFHKLTIYTGHDEQPVDPILAGQQEISETSGYPFTAYIMIDDLQLADFGNAVPAIEALFTVKTGETLADVAEAICEAGGIDPLTNLSSTALVSDGVRGYLVNRESSCWDALKPLLPVFGVDAAEVSGQIRFYRRSQTMRSTFVPGDMGAHVYGDSPPEKFLFRRDPDVTLPQETSITFTDPDRDYQPNTASSSRTEGNAKSNLAVDLPLVMTADEGASVAALMHWDAWLGRTGISFALTDSWISLATGMAYGIPIAEQVVPYRITRKLRGANGIIEVEAVSDESVTYTANVAGTSGLPPDDPSTDFADTRLFLLDMAILDDGHDDYGFYIAMAGTEHGWTRARIQASDDGITFEAIADLDQETVAGDVTGTLAAGTTTGLDDTLDTTSTLTVVLLHDQMELESATDAELDAGKNLAFVGKDGLGEYLQFKTATFVSGSTWQLTNLRRGRKGTDFAIGTHASGEEFALVDGAYRITQPLAQWGNEYSFRGVTLHQEVADAAIQTFTNTGEGKRPYSPVNVEGTWDGSNNLTVTWDSRSRLDAGGLGIDDNAEWDIEFDGSPDHTETVVAEAATFSAAEQTAAGLTPGDTVTGRVRQTSDVNDGRWREFTIVGPNAGLFLEDDITPLELEDASDFELG